MLRMLRPSLSSLVALAIALGMLLPAGAVAGPRIIDDGTEPPPEPRKPPKEIPGEKSGEDTSTPPSTADGNTGRPEVTVEDSRERWRPPDAERHDGFFLRIMATFDLWFASEVTTGTTTDVTSIGVPFASGNVEVGAAFFENLLASAEFMFFVGPVTDVTIDSVERDVDGSLGGFGFGASANYYVTPLNVFFGASGGVATVVFSREDGVGDRSGSSETGFYLSLKTGKEWWVSANWGVGLAARVVYMNLPDDTFDIDNFGVGLALSATYN